MYSCIDGVNRTCPGREAWAGGSQGARRMHTTNRILRLVQGAIVFWRLGISSSDDCASWSFFGEDRNHRGLTGRQGASHLEVMQRLSPDPEEYLRPHPPLRGRTWPGPRVVASLHCHDEARYACFTFAVCLFSSGGCVGNWQPFSPLL